MRGGNHSVVTEFILVGFPTSTNIQILIFIMFFFFHIMTITANVFIIVIVRVDHNLCCSPMYIFLSHFSFLEIWYTSVTVPKMLSDFLSENKKISFNGCLVQIYFFFSLGLTELFLLVAMAYDRYLAICRPLRYTSIMTYVLCRHLAWSSWISGFLTGFLLLIPESTLDFCGSISINHFFCDVVALLKLSCSAIYFSDILIFTLTWIIIVTSLLLIMVSYACIVQTVLKNPLATGQRKAFSTCGAHITVVATFYGTVIFMYVRPTHNYTFHMDKVVSLFYTVVTPLFNPMVYTLRNMEFRKAAKKALKRSNVFNQMY